MVASSLPSKLANQRFQSFHGTSSWCHAFYRNQFDFREFFVLFDVQTSDLCAPNTSHPIHKTHPPCPNVRSTQYHITNNLPHHLHQPTLYNEPRKCLLVLPQPRPRLMHPYSPPPPPPPPLSSSRSPSRSRAHRNGNAPARQAGQTNHRVCY